MKLHLTVWAALVAASLAVSTPARGENILKEIGKFLSTPRYCSYGCRLHHRHCFAPRSLYSGHSNYGYGRSPYGRSTSDYRYEAEMRRQESMVRMALNRERSDALRADNYDYQDALDRIKEREAQAKLKYQLERCSAGSSSQDPAYREYQDTLAWTSYLRGALQREHSRRQREIDRDFQMCPSYSEGYDDFFLTCENDWERIHGRRPESLRRTRPIPPALSTRKADPPKTTSSSERWDDFHPIVQNPNDH